MSGNTERTVSRSQYIDNLERLEYKEDLIEYLRKLRRQMVSEPVRILKAEFYMLLSEEWFLNDDENKKSTAIMILPLIKEVADERGIEI